MGPACGILIIGKLLVLILSHRSQTSLTHFELQKLLWLLPGLIACSSVHY